MPGCFELFLGLADGGDLREGVDDIRDDVVVHVPGLAGEDLGHGDAFILGLVREHRAAIDIADGEDAGDAGLEVAVDDDAFPVVELHADFASPSPSV